MLEESHRRAIWAAFETGRDLSLQELVMVTEVKPSVCLEALNGLVRNGYVAMDRFQRSSRGEVLPVFHRIKKTIRPPFEEMFGAEPKLQRQPVEAPGSVGSNVTEIVPSIEDKPVLQLRILAHTSGRIGSRKSFLEAARFAPDQRPRYLAAFKSLMRAGEIVKTRPGGYEYVDCRSIFAAAVYLTHIPHPVTTVLGIFSGGLWNVRDNGAGI
jgi:hypothetical protein